MTSKDLNELDDIRWEDLTCAYGPSLRVPEILRNLSVKDEATVANAFSYLFDFLFHQGVSLYEATGASIPFLARLARDRSSICRARVAYFIGSVALKCQDSSPGRNVDETIRQHNLHGSIAEALQSIERTIVPLLLDDDVNVRCVSPFTLTQTVNAAHWVNSETQCESLRAHMRAVMAERIAREETPRVRASIACSILWLSETGTERHIFETIVRPFCDSEVVRVSSSIVLAQRKCSLTDVESRRMVEAYADWEQMKGMFGGSSMIDPSSEMIFPWFVPSILKPILELMLEMPLLEKDYVVDALCQTAALGNRLNSATVCRILRAYLGKRPVTEMSHLNGSLKKGLLRILDVIINNDEIWNEFGALAGVIQRELGVEDSQKGRDDLRRIVHVKYRD